MNETRQCRGDNLAYMPMEQVWVLEVILAVGVTRTQSYAGSQGDGPWLSCNNTHSDCLVCITD